MASGYGAIAQYRQVRNTGGIEEADPHRLIAMLMEGAIERISAASGHMARRERSEQGANISKAISIVEGLRGSLDFKAGGELASNLDRLYDYMGRRMLRANADNDAKPLDEVAKLLRTLQEAWNTIPAGLRSARPAALAAAR